MNEAGNGHTPGPWSVPHFAKPDVNCACGYVLTEAHMGAVCTVHASGEGGDWQSHGDNPRFAEACANALLIAAAPELLAFAQMILDESDYQYQRDAARAVIAKATPSIESEIAVLEQGRVG